MPGLRRGPRCPLAGEYTVITYNPRGISGSTIDDSEQDPWLVTSRDVDLRRYLR